MYIIVSVVIILIILLILYANINKTTTEKFNNYEYDRDSNASMQQNLLTIISPYDMFIDEPTKDKLYINTSYGHNDEPVISNDINIFYDTNTYQPIEKLENKLLESNLLPYDKSILNPLYCDLNYNNGTSYCGGLGNVCSNSTDCCNGNHCINNICQQL